MKRGDLVTAAMQGDAGQPRPVLVIQSDAFAETGRVVVLPLTSTLQPAASLLRVLIEPDPQNGLAAISQVMVDRCTSVARDKLGSVFGRLDEITLQRVSRLLAVFLGIA